MKWMGNRRQGGGRREMINAKDLWKYHMETYFSSYLKYMLILKEFK